MPAALGLSDWEKGAIVRAYKKLSARDVGQIFEISHAAVISIVAAIDPSIVRKHTAKPSRTAPILISLSHPDGHRSPTLQPSDLKPISLARLMAGR